MAKRVHRPTEVPPQTKKYELVKRQKPTDPVTEWLEANRAGLLADPDFGDLEELTEAARKASRGHEVTPHNNPKQLAENARALALSTERYASLRAASQQLSDHLARGGELVISDAVMAKLSRYYKGQSDPDAFSRAIEQIYFAARFNEGLIRNYGVPERGQVSEDLQILRDNQIHFDRFIYILVKYGDIKASTKKLSFRTALDDLVTNSKTYADSIPRECTQAWITDNLALSFRQLIEDSDMSVLNTASAKLLQAAEPFVEAQKELEKLEVVGNVSQRLNPREMLYRYVIKNRHEGELLDLDIAIAEISGNPIHYMEDVDLKYDSNFNRDLYK